MDARRDRESPERGRWSLFLSQLERDGRVWLFLLGYLFAFRVLFIAVFRSRIDAASDTATLVSALLNGVRYDAIAATYGVVLPLAGTLWAALRRAESTGEALRGLTSSVLLALLSMLFVVALGYYAEYGEIFDEHISGLLLDDAGAIAVTLWKSYHPLWNGALGLALVCASCGLLRAWLGRGTPRATRLAGWASSAPARAGLLLALAVCLVGGFRGSLGRRPAQLKDAAVTGDRFLDQAVLNPVVALRYAIKQQLDLTSSAGLETFLPDRDVGRAAQRLFGSDAEEPDLDRYMERTAAGPPGTPPRHIFLIVGEGLSAWPLLPAYEALGLADGLRRLAREGVHVERFLPASYGTIESLGAILSGLPDAEIHTNYRESARQPYPSSLPPIFRRLGYRTRFFYGGFLSWQRVGEFARDQGFEEVYGGGSMGSWVHATEWGVEDEALFDFVQATATDDLPSFNVVMTTSLHPPYGVDVAARGFRMPQRSAELAGIGTDQAAFLGHYWYADRCISRFVTATAERLPGSVFAVTGDHPSRIDMRAPTLFELRAVPLILYGPAALRGAQLAAGTSGSHLDIGPTLIELAAEAGFRYHAVGRSLLGEPHRVGIGQHTVIGPTHILDLRHRPTLEPLGEVAEPAPDLVEQWQELHDAAHGFAWWRIMRGSTWRAPARASLR